MFLAAIAVAAFVSVALAPAATTDADAVKAARLAQNAAIALHKVDAIASFWTEDVTICRGLGLQLAGKAAYRKLFQDDSSSPTTVIYQRWPDSIVVSPLWPLAFESGTWTGHTGGITGPTVISGRYSAQWVKRDGRWLIRAEVFVAIDGAGPGRDFKAAP